MIEVNVRALTAKMVPIDVRHTRSQRGMDREPLVRGARGAAVVDVVDMGAGRASLAKADCHDSQEELPTDATPGGFAMISLSQLTGPVLVTVAYMALWYYLLLGLQRGTKYRRKASYEREGKVFDRYFGQDEEMLAADRAVANTHEQMGPFLISLWLCAVFFSSTLSTALGAAYVALRAVYPFLLGGRVSKMNPKRVAFVTMPCYGIVFTMLGCTVWAVLN